MGAGQWLSYGPSRSSFAPIRLIQPLTKSDIAKATVAANRIIDMRARDYADGRLKSLDLGNLGDDDKGVKIQLQNVWFRYPTRDVSILNGLDMTVCPILTPSGARTRVWGIELTIRTQIEKGQFAAIVGPSGLSPQNMLPFDVERASNHAPGSGKTTVISLLERYLMNKQGVSLMAKLG